MSTKSFPKKQDDPIEDIGIYEDDEINLLDYLFVVWNWKWFILVATALPTLAIALVLFLSPRTFTMSYAYDVQSNTSNWNLNEKNYNVMLSRFYSEENLTKLADKMQKAGLDDYVTQIRGFVAGSLGFVEFSTDPAFFDLSKLKVTDQAQLRDILNMQASLLKVKISGKPKADMQKISSAIRDNIENVLSLYPVRDQLEATIRANKNNQSAIERSRFTSRLTLKQSQNTLANLKNIEPRPLGNSESNITLQYNIGSQSQFLPLSYQIQAVETKIVALEQQVIKTEAEYNHHTDLISVNEGLLTELTEKMAGAYSIGQFGTHLANLPSDIEKAELKDYLNSYTTSIENRTSASQPITVSPRVYPVAKGTIKKSLVTLVAASMISLFAAFLLEAMKNSGSEFMGKRVTLKK